MSVVMPRVMTRGVVFIHSTPTALCPHIAWALEGVLDTRVSLDWVPQPAQPGTMRTEFSWTGEAGRLLAAIFDPVECFDPDLTPGEPTDAFTLDEARFRAEVLELHRKLHALPQAA